MNFALMQWVGVEHQQRENSNSFKLIIILLLCLELIWAPHHSVNASEVPKELKGRWVALIVEYSNADYVQKYISGVHSEAKKLGLRLEIMDAKGNRRQMARMIDDATLRNIDGIIISHGTPETISASVKRTLSRNIPIIAIHTDLELPGLIKLEQDEHKIAELILQKIVEDTGGVSKLGFIYVGGYSPMEKRLEVYNRVLAENPGIKEVFRFGEARADTALYTEITLASILKQHPIDAIDTIWAPWDEFTKGAARALMKQGRNGIRLYGVDVSDTDLQMLQDPKNPWVATAGVDPKALGKVQIRMLAHALLGNPLPKSYSLKPVLIEKSMLPESPQVTMDNLHKYVPGWGEPIVFKLEPDGTGDNLGILKKSNSIRKSMK